MLTTLLRPQAKHGPWSTGCHTRTGKNHTLCQDALKITFEPDGSIAAALADGVSGGVRGDIAAESAVDYLCLAPHAHNSALRCWLAQADSTVAQALAQISPDPGACTAVALWLNAQGKGWLTHIGDCRAYHYSPGKGLAALTQDHSYLNLKLEPPIGILPNNPAWMLGLMNAPTPKITPLQIAPGETLILCSDGLHGEISHTQIEQSLQRGLKQKIPLSRLAESLAQQAVDADGQDDIAVMLINRHAG